MIQYLIAWQRSITVSESPGQGGASRRLEHHPLPPPVLSGHPNFVSKKMGKTSKNKQQKQQTIAAKGLQRGALALPKVAGKKKRREKARPMRPVVGPRAGALMLHSAQVDAGVGTFFRFRQGTLPTSIIIEGRDLGKVAITAASATPATAVVSSFDLSVDAAGAPTVTRWGTYGALFTKWRIRRLKAILVSAMQTGTVGLNYIAFDSDVGSGDDPTTVEGVMRFQGSAMGNAYSNIEADFDAGTQLAWFNCVNTQTTTSRPGQLHFATNNYSSALVPGVLVYDYELEFADPR